MTHFAREMDHVTECVMNNIDPRTPGEGRETRQELIAPYEGRRAVTIFL